MLQISSATSTPGHADSGHLLRAWGRPLRQWDFTRPTAVIMGNEHSGVAPDLLRQAHGSLYIPMYGMIQSFNVSVAAAIILAEAARQREAAGFYAAPRVSEEALEARLNAWLEK